MTAAAHVYRIDTPRLLALPVIWLAVVAPLVGFLGLSTNAGESAAGWLGALLVSLIFAPLFYFGVWRSRLELDADGITQFQLGYTLRSSWSNVVRLSMQPGCEGLYLAESVAANRLLRGSIRVLQGLGRFTGAASVAGDAEALAQGRFIALMPFVGRLRRGPLLRDLQRWAPHLF